MSFRWTIPPETIARQQTAANPENSAWVRANAGSGKTHVLAQRVVRLLLSGVEPSKTLCLTFTKAAAANMSMRVFSTLSKWTSMDNDKLRKTLDDMGIAPDIKLEAARQLFARAVETPGGLKIQTIHAFCERILHLFPFEANVPAQFEALDEERQALLMAQAQEELLQTAAHAPSSELARALAIVASEVSGGTFDTLLQEALGKRTAIRHASTLQVDGYAKTIANKLGLLSGESFEKLTAELLGQGISFVQWGEIVAVLNNSSSRDKELAARYLTFQAASSIEDRVAAYFAIFYTKGGDPRGGKNAKLVTNAISPGIAEILDREFARVIQLRDKLRAARTVELSSALLSVSDAVLANYNRLKHLHGYLDFEDLIDSASRLLLRTDTAAWVLYKLDAGIDHILVDESQDTSPAQWAILSALSAEFFSGLGARQNHRTFFAVGDEKQSIFSFQGAKPDEFGKNEKVFARRIKDADLKFEIVPLTASFRSSKTILDAVDTVFAPPEHHAGLSSDDNVKTAHHAVKSKLPGLVEIWDLVGSQKAADPEDWRMPVDAMPENSPPAVLARRIAQKIGELVATHSREAVHDENGVKRKIAPGDIMVLVRRRDAFFEAVIRALKVANIPVAGADRLKLMEHIAVMDLVAAGRAALLPQDDLTLACVLKSPLFGFDDDDLLKLAPHRKFTLISELQHSSDPRYRDAFERVKEWGATARAFGPFRFYAKLLNAEGGRRAILARLGAEAGDAIDEFLRIALEWEQTETPSLTAFLHRMRNADIEIKRDLEAAGEAVRVMTVHASKGLEAKIVFLPDTCALPSTRFDPKILEIGNEDAALPVWNRGKKDNPQAVQKLIDEFHFSQGAEYRRLLYVAMTRAEERLYIAGHHGKNGPAKHSWYEMIRATLRVDGVPLFPASWGEGEISRIGEAAILDSPETPKDSASKTAQPAWLSAPAPEEAPPPPPIRPSQALGAADQLELAGEFSSSGNSDALLAGSLLHTLLQYLPELPPEKRLAAAERFIAQKGSRLEAIRRAAIAREALAVLEDGRLAPLFAPGSRAEIPIAGRVPTANGGIEITGRIDRLGVTAEAVHIADFKSGLIPAGAAPPAKYVTQMALYSAALAPLFPGKAVRAFIVWTGGPIVSELDEDLLRTALASLPGAPAAVKTADKGS